MFCCKHYHIGFQGGSVYVCVVHSCNRQQPSQQDVIQHFELLAYEAAEVDAVHVYSVNVAAPGGGKLAGEWLEKAQHIPVSC